MTYLIDASVFIFRAWFGIPDTMTDAEQNPVTAVYGFARFWGDFLESVQPEYVAAAFDASLRTSFRNEIYPEYKANRDPAPLELKRQFDQCREVTRALGVMECADTGYEADDLIGTLTARMREAGHTVTILSRDKDLAQLLRQGDTFWDYVVDRKIGYDEIPEAFGVRPEQIVDYLALAGDSVDNIPGVPGIGRKTAAHLLQRFESVDELYSNLGQIAGLSLRGAGRSYWIGWRLFSAAMSRSRRCCTGISGAAPGGRRPGWAMPGHNSRRWAGPARSCPSARPATGSPTSGCPPVCRSCRARRSRCSASSRPSTSCS
jgi:5'-3' exonuclease